MCIFCKYRLSVKCVFAQLEYGALCMKLIIIGHKLSDLETDRKGSHSWHSRPVLFFWIMYKIYIFHAVRAKILMSFFCMNM